jgi:hypothetical protein
MEGRVVEFDAVRGIGTVEEAGGARHRFHAANIADGSRRIEVEAPVTFERLARFGTWEATAIRPRS